MSIMGSKLLTHYSCPYISPVCMQSFIKETTRSAATNCLLKDFLSKSEAYPIVQVLKPRPGSHPLTTALLESLQCAMQFDICLLCRMKYTLFKHAFAFA